MANKCKIKKGMHVKADFGGGTHHIVYVKSVRKGMVHFSYSKGSYIIKGSINRKHVKC